MSFAVVFIIIIVIVSFLLGIFFIIDGFDNKGRKQTKKVFTGIGLILSIPFWGFISEQFQEKDTETSILGVFSLEGNNKIVLKLYKDKTFELFKGQKCVKQGKGKWHIDIADDCSHLVLNLDSNQLWNEMRYSIIEHDRETNLLPFDSSLDVLIKHKIPL